MYLYIDRLFHIIELEIQLKSKKVDLRIEACAREWLAVHGFDKQMGARLMARIIQDKIKKPLADKLLFGCLSKGGTVTISVKQDDELNFNYEASQALA